MDFVENGPVDVAQLNALYRMIGWDKKNRRTEAETAEMLRVSHYYIAAQTDEAASSKKPHPQQNNGVGVHG